MWPQVWFTIDKDAPPPPSAPNPKKIKITPLPPPLSPFSSNRIRAMNDCPRTTFFSTAIADLLERSCTMAEMLGAPAPLFLDVSDFSYCGIVAAVDCGWKRVASVEGEKTAMVAARVAQISNRLTDGEAFRIVVGLAENVQVSGECAERNDREERAAKTKR